MSVEVGNYEYAELANSAGELYVGQHIGFGADNSVAPVTSSNPLPVTDAPVASGGMSTASYISTSAVMSQSVKATAGTVYAVRCFHIDATPVYVKVYDKASAASASDTPIERMGVKANGTSTLGEQRELIFPKGLACSNGIAIRATSSITDAGTGALTADEVIVEIDYK